MCMCLCECVSEPTQTQTCRDIYCKELSHVIMEAEKGHALQWASRRRRRVKESLEFGRAEITFSSQAGRLKNQEMPLFFFCPSSKAWKYQIIPQGDFLYSAFLICFGLHLVG